MGFMIPGRWLKICLETLCWMNPFPIFAQCLLSLRCSFCVVRPIYWYPQMQSNKYITNWLWHVRWYFMGKSSFECVDWNCVTPCLIILQHWHRTCLHLKLPFSRCNVSSPSLSLCCFNLLGARIFWWELF